MGNYKKWYQHDIFNTVVAGLILAGIIYAVKIYFITALNKSFTFELWQILIVAVLLIAIIYFFVSYNIKTRTHEDTPTIQEEYSKNMIIQYEEFHKTQAYKYFDTITNRCNDEFDSLESIPANILNEYITQKIITVAKHGHGYILTPKGETFLTIKSVELVNGNPDYLKEYF